MMTKYKYHPLGCWNNLKLILESDLQLGSEIKYNELLNMKINDIKCCRWCGRRNNVRCPQKEKPEIKAWIWIKMLIVMNRRVRKLLHILALNLTTRQQWWTTHSRWVELSEFAAASGFTTLSRCWEFWAASLPGFWGRGAVTWIGGPPWRRGSNRTLRWWRYVVRRSTRHL